MNIKILHSWLRDYLKTKATPQKIAEYMSLTSVSIEKIESFGNDFIYNIEVTTNRPDLMSIVGLAREAGAILPRFGIDARFEEAKLKPLKTKGELGIEIRNDARLVNRICAVALEVSLGPSPEKIQKRLQASDINAHNNVIDVTNYVLREIGHPIHAFDYDKITTKKMIIRESRDGEKIRTLDGAFYELAGGDIVADNGKGEIIDLLGIKGTKNSAVSDSTCHVLLFVDNNDRTRIRKTSMNLALRTEAAILNEKGVDPELSYNAMLRAIELLNQIANARVISEIVDIYPNKPKPASLSISSEKVNSIIGVNIPLKTSAKILEDLGCKVSLDGSDIKVSVPTWRLNDIEIEEDLVEEIARVWGYHKLPSILPCFETGQPFNPSSNSFYWEQKTKDILKYLGFIEIYTYSMVGEDMLEIEPSDAVEIRNPLDQDHVLMRTTIVPSLLSATRENKNRENLRLFELANVYLKKSSSLPDEKLKLTAIIKQPKLSFLETKGIIEVLFEELGISHVEFKQTGSGTTGAGVYIKGEFLGEIEQLEPDLVDFEFDFETILKHVTLRKKYKPISKFPESVEDLRFEIDETVPYEKIVRTIKTQSSLIKNVSLLDVYKNKKTFRIIYQSHERNLTSEDLTDVREKIISALKKSLKADPA